MEKLREVKDMQGMLRFLKENMDIIKKAALPAVVILALVVFWVFGGEEDLIIQEGQTGEHGITAESGAEGEAGGTEASEASETDGVTWQGGNSGGTVNGGDIYVDLGGEVVNPGVYKIPSGTRLFQVIEKAGGLKETADTDSINQAEPVTDGQKIIIGSKDETSAYYTGVANTGTSADGSSLNPSSSGDGNNAVRQTEEGPVVNINRATLKQLQLIPGVGPSTAQKILDYREANGDFQQISDIKKISGIGDKTYENLKDYIEV